MSDLRSQMIRMAADLPKGDPTRRKLLSAVRHQGGGKTARAETVPAWAFEAGLAKDALGRAVAFAREKNRKLEPDEEPIEIRDLEEVKEHRRSGRDYLTYEFQDGASVVISVAYSIKADVEVDW